MPDASAAERSRDRQNKKSLSAAKSLQDKHILDMKGAQLLSQLRHLFMQECEAFNAEPGNTGTLSFLGSRSGFKMSCKGSPARVSGEFAEDGISINGENGVAYQVEYDLRLTPDGLGVWLSDKNGSPYTLKDIVDSAVDALLGASGR
jgi:hypothetical protein